MKISSDQNSLFNKTLVITRAQKQSTSLLESLKNLGAEVIEYPCIEIEILPGLSEKLRKFGDFKQFTDLIFTSINGVRIFFQTLEQARIKCLMEKTILTIGPKTNTVLKEFGIHGGLIPKQFQAEGILEMLADDLRGRSFLLLRAKNARSILLDTIQKRGGDVLDFPLYESLAPKNLIPLDRLHDGVCFTSVSTVLHYARHTPIRESDVAFVIGNITAQSAQKAGFKKVFVAQEATIESLVETIIKILSVGESLQ